MADKTGYCDVCCEEKELDENGKLKLHKTYLDGGGRFQPLRTCPRSNRKPTRKK